jgi:2-C-methyl-D-erythritol 4-phosphate cytidylyltransferase
MAKDISVIIAAAGKSRRFGDDHFKKPFVRLEQKAVWLYSAERFLNRDDVRQVIMVIAPDDQEDFLSRFGPNVAILGIDVVLGGAERADSVEKGLAGVAPESRLVVIHDAARPCVSDEDIEAVIAAGRKHGAAILATPVHSTIKTVANHVVSGTVPRNDKWLAQTPQVFDAAALRKAFAGRGTRQPTDESEMLEAAGHAVHVVSGSPLNIKITTRRDLKLAAAILKTMPPPKLDGAIHPFADDNLWR